MDEKTPAGLAGVAWNDLAAFLAVARHGGLSPAARETGSSAPTLTRRMRALERTLNRELFVRGTHGYGLTDEGRRLRDALAPAEAAIASATTPRETDTPPLVKIAAGSWTALALARNVSRIAGDPPDLRVRLMPGETVLSLPRREASIGFRNARPIGAGLAGRRLRRVRFAPYAAAPTAPARSLAQSHASKRWIVVRADTASARWVAERCGPDVAAETDRPHLALDLALAGAGRAVLPTFIGDETPGLVRAGETIEALEHDQWLVTHDEDRHQPGLRRALDRIGELFG